MLSYYYLNEIIIIADVGDGWSCKSSTGLALQNSIVACEAHSKSLVKW